MKVDKIIQKAKEVLRLEGESVLNLVDRIDNSFTEIVDLICATKGRVVLSGMGKSGLIARKIVATLNSTGTASIYLHPTDALHGDLGMVRQEDVVILISKSGNTEEIENLVPLLKRLNVTIIGMLGNLDSKVGRVCDYILDVNVKEEACPYDLAPTTSTTAALAMGDALAIALLEKRGFTKEDFAFLHPGGSLGKRLSLKISEIMVKGDDIPLIKMNSKIKDIIYEITSKRLGATCVVDSNGKLKGIITDGDLRRLLEKTLDIKEISASDMMSKNPKTIKEDYLASFALQFMENYKITSLVVINDDNKPVGMIHIHSLIEIGLQKR